MKICMVLMTLIATISGGNCYYDYYHYDTSTRYPSTTETPTTESVTTDSLWQSNAEVLSVPTGECGETENLISLNLSYTGMKRINEGFIKNVHVSCLNFSKNSIDFISHSFLESLPNLTYLNLAHNQISLSELKLNPNAQRLQLKTLVLDHNFIRSYSKLRFQDDLYNLENLYVRQSGINSIYTAYALQNLKYLYLSDNYISSEKGILSGEDYQNLSHLYLERNKINQFNATRFQNLEFLQLDNNEIETLCNLYCYYLNSYLSLGKMNKLKHLSLSGNAITDIILDTFTDTINLVTLDLSNNRISTVKGDALQKLSHLKILLLNENQLTTLPNLLYSSKIEILNLSYNNLSSIPTGQFSQLGSLKNLSLNNNFIMNIEQRSFTNLSSLYELNLSNNNLENLPKEWMLPQNTLTILRLNDNYFTDFYHLSLYNAQSLEQVFLQRNALDSLNATLLSHLSKNAIIHIDGQTKTRLSEIKEIKSKIWRSRKKSTTTPMATIDYEDDY